MKQKFVIVITREECNEMSIHPSFTKACAAYDWDRSKFAQIPAEHDGYTISKHPFETTIDCLELISYCSRNDVACVKDEDDRRLYVDFKGYNQEVQIVINKSTRIESCIWYDENKQPRPIRVDEYTEEQLLTLID